MPPFIPDSSVVERVEPSPNFDERTGLARPDMIVLHYTGMPFTDDAIHRLCDPKARVSAHYCVLERGSILQFVPESKRAWHAGISTWNGDPDVNSRSIGIEIANPGHDYGYPDFPKRQIAAAITLCRALLTRNIIRPENIVAHSDVAPGRKKDPGEKFPWRQLALSGVGLWVEPAPPSDTIVLKPGDAGETVTALQKALIDYGYGLEETGQYDTATGEVVAAFQRHFRPARIDGIVDSSTQDTLRKLLAARDTPAAPKAPNPPARPAQREPAAAEDPTAAS
ncbi:MAG: N-acetylmuramoyl-L-alanine amidase [Xanthobacteraceae bacterium]